MSTIAPLSMLAGTILVDKSEQGWELVAPPDGSDRPREFQKRVQFNFAFGSLPLVHVSLVGFDIDNGDYARLRVAAVDIDAGGFTLLVSTSCGTQVHAVEASWLALGT